MEQFTSWMVFCQKWLIGYQKNTISGSRGYYLLHLIEIRLNCSAKLFYLHGYSYGYLQTLAPHTEDSPKGRGALSFIQSGVQSNLPISILWQSTDILIKYKIGSWYLFGWSCSFILSIQIRWFYSTVDRNNNEFSHSISHFYGEHCSDRQAIRLQSKYIIFSLHEMRPISIR